MIDYSQGKIYKLVCNTTGKVYIGSTTKKYLSDRLAGHRKNYNEYLYKDRRYITSFEILKGENYKIVLIELFPCKSKDELRMREQYYIDSMDCINKYSAYTTKEEAKIKAQEYRKERYALHKDTIKKQINDYRQNNKEHIKKVRKAYYDKNIEKMRLKDREKYQKHKDKILARDRIKNKERVECDVCGKDLCRGYINKHKRKFH